VERPKCTCLCFRDFCMDVTALPTAYPLPLYAHALPLVVYNREDGTKAPYPKSLGSSCIGVTYPCLRAMRSDYLN